ncbi:MAG: YeeE/YedE family protein [Spirochaetota bacterium]
MWEAITGPWPWYVSGPMLGLMVPILLLLGNKNFGISSTLRHACAAVLPVKADYFRNGYDWRSGAWNLVLALGVVVGALIAVLLLGGNRPPAVAPAALELFETWRVSAPSSLQPAEIFAVPGVWSVRAIVSLVFGGFLVGFGTRYANGCTSGHAIMGLSLLNVGSLVATLGFFAGGVIVSNFVLPWVMSL